MIQRWSAIFCATGAWGGKPIGRMRVNSQVPSVQGVQGPVAPGVGSDQSENLFDIAVHDEPWRLKRKSWCANSGTSGAWELRSDDNILNPILDGSFVGRKACVPGCFAGDNVIVEERWEADGLKLNILYDSYIYKSRVINFGVRISIKFKWAWLRRIQKRERSNRYSKSGQSWNSALWIRFIRIFCCPWRSK